MIINKIIYTCGFLFLVNQSYAATYYVSTTGKDESNRGSLTAPFRTIAYASQKLASGDTLYIRAGTYIEGLVHNYGGFKFVNGISKSKRTRYTAYPGERRKVIIKPPRGLVGDLGGGATFTVLFDRTTQFVEVSGLVLDATNGSWTDSTSARGVSFEGSYKEGRWAKNNLLLDNEIRFGGGIGGGGGNEIIGNWIHHSEVYGIYAWFDGGIIEGNIIEDNYGFGLHLYEEHHSVNGWIVRNNIFRRNGNNYRPDTAGRDGSKIPLPGVILTRGSSQFYNNLVYDNPNGGVTVGLGAKNMLVANNTIYGNGVHGIRVNAASSSARIVNNITWGNGGEQIINLGVNTKLESNMTTDPKFVNAAARDFRLKTGSLAINKGVPLLEVPFDFTKARRLDGAFDTAHMNMVL